MKLSMINKIINILNSFLKCKSFYFILIIVLYAYSTEIYKEKNKNTITNINQNETKIITENFFIIDSNRLKHIESHIYGFVVSKNGILTNDYYKDLGYWIEPEPTGIYIMIIRKRNKIKIIQDYNGAFGLYIYENKTNGYFAISNSFLLLEEYLVGKHHLTFNKDFSDNFIISELCSSVIKETMINEIINIPSNAQVIINIKKKSYILEYIDYMENTVLLESKEGLEIIDKWVDKWAYIIRSLKLKTNNIIFDLSGGFDTRLILSIFLNSGININDLSIRSYKNLEEDYKIATNISEKYGFLLNKPMTDSNKTIWNNKDCLFFSMYCKLGYHKVFIIPNGFYNKSRFLFTGSGGELIRGNPNSPIRKFIEFLSSPSKLIEGHKEEFHNSSMKIFNRSINLIKNIKNYSNDYEIATNFYAKGRNRYHFGKSALERYMCNVYSISPLIDPDIRKIKYEINERSQHDLLAYIYIRFIPDLIYIPIQGNRKINQESIKKAEQLNKLINFYQRKSDYNKNFFIENKRISPIQSSIKKTKDLDYLKELYNSTQFLEIFSKLYDLNVYYWLLRHDLNYGILSIVKILADLSYKKIIY